MDAINILQGFSNQKIMIVGDVMLDAYLWGKTTRISPEAPVPVVAVTNKEDRLGGAANVAMNIKTLGAEPIMVATVGDDEKGRLFRHILIENGMSDAGIIADSSSPTIVKTRVICDGQHMLRVDEEETHDLKESVENEIIRKVQALCLSRDIKAIILEDYNKGTLTKKVIQEIIKFANENHIIVAVDPKKKNFLEYKNATLFKPNLKELREGLKVDVDVLQQESVKEAIKILQTQINAEIAFITLSEYGVFCSSEKFEGIIPAHKREIADVSGAGDTVISVATLCLAAGASHKIMAELANLAGGLVCEEVGVVPLTLEKLEKEARKAYTTIHEGN